ncbi:MAG: histidine kinase dimerization/phosphoacceptor domain -containing protein [Polaribacter sp.]|uniref:tetratricopeptide repeat-containing sensor histidine kinase n=1 Tax=Polaribacter sp. TaxID=1920175 RepID=UPI002F3501DC
MKKITYILFLSFSIVSFSQNITINKMIDSAYYFKNSNPEKAFFYLNKITLSNLSKEERIKFIKIKYSLLDFVGEYQKQLEFIENILINSSYSKNLRIDLLASTYYNLGEYQKQLAYYKEGLVLNKENINLKIKYLNNLGWAYKLLNNTNKALEHYNKGLKLLKEKKLDTLTKIYATLLGNSGLIYTKKGNFKEALKRFTISKKIRKNLNNKGYLAGSYLDIAELYAAQNQLNKAINFNKKALEIVLPINGREWILRSFKNLYVLKEKQHNYKDALFYKKEYDSLNTLLFNKKTLKKQSYLKAKIEYEHSLIALEKENKVIEKTAFIRLIIILSSVLFFCIFIIVIYILSKKNKKIDSINNQLFNRNKEKEILLKEIHHRVKNNLQLISSLLNIQSRYTDKEEVKSMFLDGKSRIKSMALVHQKLYENEQLDSVDFKDYLTQIVKNLLISYGSKTKVNFTIDSIENLDIDLSITLGLIFNEIITNSLKYNNELGSLKITISLKKEKEAYVFIISDDGIGFDINKVKKIKTLGLQLIAILVKQLEAEKTITSSKNSGVLYTIKIPV